MSVNPYPGVSVIIPCYKVTAFIAEALESLRAQSFRNFEVIVVNDGCPDSVNLEQILEPYRREIRYIKQDNQGRSGARNAGIGVARAPILAFLDGDDLWEPEYLQYQFGFLQANREIDLVYPNAVLFGPAIDEPGAWRTFATSARPDLFSAAGTLASNQDRLFFMDLFPSAGEVTVESLIKGRCRVMSSLMARREIILRAGGYDVDLWVCEDLDLWIRIARMGGRFAYHTRPLCRYRIHSGGATSRSLFLRSGLVAVLEKQYRTPGLPPQERRVLDEELHKEKGMLDFLLGRKELYRGNCEQALEYLNRARSSVKGRRLWLTTAALRLVPQLLSRYVRSRYRNEEAFVS